jgi:hypothetical protein
VLLSTSQSVELIYLYLVCISKYYPSILNILAISYKGEEILARVLILHFTVVGIPNKSQL